MNVILLIFCFFSAEVNSKSIVIFSVCLEGHIRRSLSIASSLLKDPQMSVTLICNKSCGEYIKKFDLAVTLLTIESRVDCWDQAPTSSNLSKYILELSTDYIHYIYPKWKDLEKKPDLIISDLLCIGCQDLAEIFQIPNIVVARSLYALSLFGPEIYQFQYLRFYTQTEQFQPVDSAFVRSYRYLMNRVMKIYFTFDYYLQVNKIRREIGLTRKETSNFHSFYVVQSYLGFEEPRELPSDIELVGFFQISVPLSPLDSDLEEWLDESKGFILLYAGPTHNFTEKQERVFKTLIEKSSYDFLVISKTMQVTAKNAKVVNGFRPEALSKKNVMCSITFGDYTSVCEAIQNKVPLICVPLDSDEYYNCDLVRINQFGKFLSVSQFKYEKLSDLIEEVSQDHKIKESLTHFAHVINLYKGSERILELAQQFTENGYQNFVPRWRNLAWVLKKDLDIFCFIFGIFFLVLCFFFKVMEAIFGFFSLKI